MTLANAFDAITRKLSSLLCRPFRHCQIQDRSNTTLGYYLSAKMFISQEQKASAARQLHIHRTLLWDDCEPSPLMPMICSVRSHTLGLSHVMWNTEQVEHIVHSNPDLKFYFNYQRRIMRADLARYLILLKYGGAYFDLDIHMHRRITSFFEETKQDISVNMRDSQYCILFEEHRWKSTDEAVDQKEQPIRLFLEPEYQTEALTRVANYAMICTPEHPFMHRIIQVCKERSHLKATDDYDVLFITGPDVVSHIYHTATPSFLREHNVILISLEEHNKFITHHHVGNWRTS